MNTTATSPVRQRILDAAAEHYYADGIRAVSADRLIAAVGVSKVTFYRHFPTKDDLVTAYLALSAAAEVDRVTAARAGHVDDPAAVLRWYADQVGQLSCRPGFRGCPFINAAAELSDADHPGRTVIDDHRAWLTGQARELLEQMGVTGAGAVADQLMMLRDGAMVSGYLGRAPEQVAASLVEAGRAVIGRASAPR